LNPADYEAWVGTKERLEYVSPDASRGVFTTYWNYFRTEGRKARVFDLATRKEVLTAARPEGDLSLSNLSCSSHGTRFLLNPGYRQGDLADVRTAAIWDMATGGKVFEFPQRDSYRNHAFLSPDGRFVVVVNGSYAPETKEQNVMGEVWDTLNGKQVSRFELIGKRGPETAGISPDGRTVVVATRQEIFVVDLLIGRLRLRADPSDQGPRSPVVFSPDGRQFAIGQYIGGSGRGMVQVWETASGSIRHTFNGHLKETRTVAFSPDSRLLASGSDDSTVVVWDLEAVAVPPELRVAKSEHLWRSLAGPDAAAAYMWIKVLALRPNDAVTLIGENTKPASPEAGGPAVVKRLIAQLDAKSYRDREAATKSLGELGLEAAELLKEALAGRPSAEAEKRLKDILAAIAQARPTPETIRAARAVEVLERVGTPEAKAVLRKLAAGRPGHALTEDAKASLVRLGGK
jgi:hypothetical protein